jgi:hypothetical protein
MLDHFIVHMPSMAEIKPRSPTTKYREFIFLVIKTSGEFVCCILPLWDIQKVGTNCISSEVGLVLPFTFVDLNAVTIKTAPLIPSCVTEV